MPWLAGEPGAWRIALHVQPGASRTEVAGVVEGCLKLRVAAPPIEGRANEAIVRWVADRLDLPRSRVSIAGGERGRRKRVEVTATWTAAEVARRLAGGGG